MVFNVHYKSFKDMDFKNRVPFIMILMVIMMFVIVAWDPPLVLFLMAIMYASSGPLMAVYSYRKRLGQKSVVSSAVEVEEEENIDS